MKKVGYIALAVIMFFSSLSGCAAKQSDSNTDISISTASEAVQTEQIFDSESEKEQESEQNTPDDSAQGLRPREIDYEDPEWFRDAMVIDIDCDWPAIYLDDLATRDRMISRAEYYFDRLANTEVTDVTICAFEQISYVQSETMEWIYEKVAGAVETGQKLEGFESQTAKYSVLYRALNEFDIDWMQLALEKAKAVGIRPWVYLRMNDLHYAGNDKSPYHDRFWYYARENGFLMGEGYGRPNGSANPISSAYDFSHAEVREWMLAYIEELVMKYDAFGLDLDFMRNIYCFDYLNDNEYAQDMTDFVRQVRSLLDQAEAIHGHPMKLMIRLGRSIEHNYIYGFDVAAWVQEGLIDAIIPSPEAWIDSGIPVDEWKALVGEHVAVFPGFENWMMGNADVSVEMIKGYGASFYAMGADGLYFNNYYQLGSLGPSIWPLSREDMSTGTRTYIVSDQDLYPIGSEPYHPLPIALHEADESGVDFPVYLGEIDSSEYVYVVVGYNTSFKTEFVTTVTLNGEEPVKAESYKPAKGDLRGYVNTGATGNYRLQAGRNLYYCFQNVSLKEGEPLIIHFSQNPGEKCNVEYLEITIQSYEQLFW